VSEAAHSISIREAVFPDDEDTARALFREYAAELNVDLCFQDFDRELEELSTMYGPPRGALLLATLDGETCGCVALRAQDGEACEMKRLYVRAQARGAALGKRLAQAVIDKARALAYRRMVLDTLPSLQAAQGIYETLGFRDIAPYYHNPIAGARYLALTLR
jgi:putative acetyltransferase